MADIPKPEFVPFAASRITERDALRNISPARGVSADELTKQLGNIEEFVTRNFEADIAQRAQSQAVIDAREALNDFFTQKAADISQAPEGASLELIAGAPEGQPQVGVGASPDVKGALEDPSRSIKDLLRDESGLVKRIAVVRYNETLRKEFAVSSASAFANNLAQLQEDFLTDPEKDVDALLAKAEGLRLTFVKSAQDIDETGQLSSVIDTMITPLAEKFKTAIVEDRLDAEETAARERMQSSLAELQNKTLMTLSTRPHTPKEFRDIVGTHAQTIIDALNRGTPEDQRAAAERLKQFYSEATRAYYRGNFIDRKVDEINRLLAVGDLQSIERAARLVQEADRHLDDLETNRKITNVRLAGYKSPLDRDGNPLFVSPDDMNSIVAELRGLLPRVEIPSGGEGGGSGRQSFAAEDVLGVVKSAILRRSTKVENPITIFGYRLRTGDTPPDITQYARSQLELAQRFDAPAGVIQKMELAVKMAEAAEQAFTVVDAALSETTEVDVPGVAGFVREKLKSSIEDIRRGLALPEEEKAVMTKLFEQMLDAAEGKGKFEDTSAHDAICSIRPDRFGCSFDSVLQSAAADAAGGKSQLTALSEQYTAGADTASRSHRILRGEGPVALPSGVLNGFAETVKEALALGDVELARKHIAAMGVSLIQSQRQHGAVFDRQATINAISASDENLGAGVAMAATMFDTLSEADPAEAGAAIAAAVNPLLAGSAVDDVSNAFEDVFAGASPDVTLDNAKSLIVYLKGGTPQAIAQARKAVRLASSVDTTKAVNLRESENTVAAIFESSGLSPIKARAQARQYMRNLAAQLVLKQINANGGVLDTESVKAIADTFADEVKENIDEFVSQGLRVSVTKLDVSDSLGVTPNIVYPLALRALDGADKDTVDATINNAAEKILDALTETQNPAIMRAVARMQQRPTRGNRPRFKLAKAPDSAKGDDTLFRLILTDSLGAPVAAVDFDPTQGLLGRTFNSKIGSVIFPGGAR